MKILLASHKFAPDVGGIETMSELLANYFVDHGHEVTVVTHTKSDDGRGRRFDVLRGPSALALWQASRQTHVVFHNNICLRFAWPQLFLRRPWVIAVRTWVTRNSGRIGARDRIKRWVLSRARVVAISEEVAKHIASAHPVVIPNGYRDHIFTRGESTARNPEDLAFVGRLVEAKGLQILLMAMTALPDEVNLDVMGSGPYEVALRAQVREYGLEGRVRFRGELKGAALVDVLRTRGTLVVPSLWNEPFGIVALEGLGAGCWVVASEGGGLSEAVGNAGLLFPNGDPDALRSELAKLFSQPELRARLSAETPAHLSKHTTHAMASRYLEVLVDARGAQ